MSPIEHFLMKFKQINSRGGCAYKVILTKKISNTQ